MKVRFGRPAGRSRGQSLLAAAALAHGHGHGRHVPIPMGRRQLAPKPNQNKKIGPMMVCHDVVDSQLRSPDHGQTLLPTRRGTPQPYPFLHRFLSQRTSLLTPIQIQIQILRREKHSETIDPIPVLLSLTLSSRSFYIREPLSLPSPWVCTAECILLLDEVAPKMHMQFYVPIPIPTLVSYTFSTHHYRVSSTTRGDPCSCC